MLKQMEGSQAVAEAVALCRPEVVCAYPITPQTHIVEGVGRLVKEGTLENCERSAPLRPAPAATPRPRARVSYLWARPSTTPPAWACPSS
jgi:hypothetical protein